MSKLILAVVLRQVRQCQPSTDQSGPFWHLDLNITHLQQEKTTLSQSLEEARRTCTEAVQKLTAETERVLRSEEQLNRLRAESSKQVIKITNLESVLQAAQERERLSARSTRELELQLGDFNGRASAGEAEKRRVLEDKVRSLESELKKMEGDLERERSKGAGAAEQGMDWGAPVGVSVARLSSLLRYSRSNPNAALPFISEPVTALATQILPLVLLL